MIENELARLLKAVIEIERQDFSGLGIIVTDQPDKLPITNLKIADQSYRLPAIGFQDILGTILQVSSGDNPYHDGFHVIEPPFSLVALSQYFSTPIIKGSDVDYRFGSRFRTALYGSTLPHVTAVGVISQSYEAAIFIKGRKLELNAFL
jgi:hypothetical protein